MASSDNRGPELLYVCAVMVGMAFISTVLRVYVRLGVVKAFGIDDWFMVAATVRPRSEKLPDFVSLTAFASLRTSCSQHAPLAASTTALAAT